MTGVSRGPFFATLWLAAACNASDDGGETIVAPSAAASAFAPEFEAAPTKVSASTVSASAIEAENGNGNGNGNEPRIASTVIAATVYSIPDTNARRLGYIRLGGSVRRDPEPTAGKGCKGAFYRIEPTGYVCTDEATTDLSTPVVRAAARRPDLSKPLPYKYGFVRATAPQYLKVPTKEEQLKSEFKLEDHLQWFAEHRLEVQRPFLGANDVPLDERGVARVGLSFPPGTKLSTQLGLDELFGGTPGGGIPWWLEGGRKIPNVSGYEVPEYALFADRVRRKTGLSFVDAFNTSDGGLERRFAVTVDMRLIPTTKVKPDTGSLFHGVEITEETPVPFGFVNTRTATTWKLIKGQDLAKPGEPVPRRAIIPLTGKARIKEGRRFYQTALDPRRWLAAQDIGVVDTPPTWPEDAEKGEKWIDISLVQQTLVLYEGKKPFYATLVSTGQDRLGDPKTSKATPQGSFRIRSKHIAAAMDSDENSTVAGGTKTNQHLALDAEARATVERLRAAQKVGKALDADDQRRLANIEKGRHPEYGITMRRGSANYELRDVPWIQYFAAGYALHGAYWHDVFGIPRSHGCVNLSPIDARLVFSWTEPAVPNGWHGMNVESELGTGTRVVVRE